MASAIFLPAGTEGNFRLRRRSNAKAFFGPGFVSLRVIIAIAGS